MSSKDAKPIAENKPEIRIRSLNNTENRVSNITKLAVTMISVEINSDEAKINATSIENNNGKRIELNNTEYLKK